MKSILDFTLRVAARRMAQTAAHLVERHPQSAGAPMG